MPGDSVGSSTPKALDLLFPVQTSLPSSNIDDITCLNILVLRSSAGKKIGLDVSLGSKQLLVKGDGSTDDTVILNSVLSYAANLSSVVYFPFGVYMRIVNILELLSCCHDLRPSLSDDTGADGNFQCILNWPSRWELRAMLVLLRFKTCFSLFLAPLPGQFSWLP
jgi:hypothetical protein